MDRVYLGDPNDADVDTLLSQLHDENLMKMKTNTHTNAHSLKSKGFDYPTFTANETTMWLQGEDEVAGGGMLEGQLNTRYSNLKLPIVSSKNGRESDSAKKKAKDAEAAKKARDSAMARIAKDARDSEVAKQLRDAEQAARIARDPELARIAKDVEMARQLARDSELARDAIDSKVTKKKAKDSELARKAKDSKVTPRQTKDSELSSKPPQESEVAKSGAQAEEATAKEESSSRRSSSRRDSIGSSRRSSTRREDGNLLRRSVCRREDGSLLTRESSGHGSDRTEFHSFRSDEAEEDDAESIDAILNERFKALKSATSPAPVPAPAPAPNAALDNPTQVQGQLSSHDYKGYGSVFSAIPWSPASQFSGHLSSHDYEGYGSSLSSPNSPSSKLLHRSRSRSSPRVLLTNSVSTSFHCSAPSPLKLLKQVSGAGSKKAASKSSTTATPRLPPLPPAAAGRPSPTSTSPVVSDSFLPASNGGREYKVEGFGNSNPVGKESVSESPGPDRKVGREYKVEGFGNAKPVGKESEKKSKKKSKDRGRGVGDEENQSPSPVKDMRRLLSSVADRVTGFERTKVSSADEDEYVGAEYLGGDLLGWSVLERERELARASSEEATLSRQADRVVEWARDAARLGFEESESGSEMEVEQLEPIQEEEHESDGSSREKSSEADKPQQQILKPKKRWGFF